MSIGTPENVTARVGYDNQPSFAPDGRSLFFTSQRDDAQADIYRYDLGTRATSRVTTTAPESEYSATVMPGGGAISVIRVERDSAQRLWRVPLGADASSVILQNVKPVGYHAWADDHTLALFVLGSPNTLQVADTRTGKSDTLETSIGRSLHRIPGQRRISFVHKQADSTWWIKSLDPASRSITRLVQLPAGVEDYAWTAGGRIVIGNGAKLMSWDSRSAGAWEEIADLSSAGLGQITRLAISPSGDRIALVAIPK